MHRIVFGGCVWSKVRLYMYIDSRNIVNCVFVQIPGIGFVDDIDVAYTVKLA